MRLLRGLVSVLAGSLGLVTLVACSSTPTTTPGVEPTSAGQLAVTVLQQRVDATTRTVGVETTNHGDKPVHVSAVRLSGGGIDGPTTKLDTDLQPGLTVALRTSYGRPDCADRDDPVVAHLTIGDRTDDFAVDRRGQVEVHRLLDTDCAKLRLAETVSVRLAGPYRDVSVDGQPRLAARLVLARRSTGPAADLRSLDGSVLIDLLTADSLIDLPESADRAVTAVLLGSNGRYDPHALGGSTQTFLLSAYVRLGDLPEQRVVPRCARRGTSA